MGFTGRVGGAGRDVTGAGRDVTGARLPLPHAELTVGAVSTVRLAPLCAASTGNQGKAAFKRVVWHYEAWIGPDATYRQGGRVMCRVAKE